MTAISITSVHVVPGEVVWRAVAGEKRSQGKTMGEALDALTQQLALDAADGASVIFSKKQPDQFFTAAQQQRLATLMVQWRAARGTGQSLSLDESRELEALIAAEVEGAGNRVPSCFAERV